MAWSPSQKHVSFGGEAEVRYPAVAGQFYPAQPQRLRAQVDELLQAARLGPQQGIVHAVIAPHAGYIYSGPTAGYSFRSLPPPDGRTVYLLGPAHYVPLSGVAVGEFRAMATPLGQTPVAVEQGHRLVAERCFIHPDEGAHTPEHCLEVELPFLQVLAGAPFRVVPLLFGRVDPVQVAAVLGDAIAEDESALVVVSSDLSHYHSYEAARKLDTAFLNAVVSGDLVAAARGEACGLLPILTLMLLAARFDWRPRLLDYRNSGDTAGDRSRVVGYGAVAYAAV